MANIAKLILPDESEYDIKDASAVASVTYSGHTVTVTMRNGTTATFDTADTTYSAVTASADGLMTSTMYSDAVSPLGTAITQAEVNELFT